MKFNANFTLVGTFSRLPMVTPWFNALDKMTFDKSKCNLLIYDNAQGLDLKNALLKNIEQRQNEFKSVRYYKSHRRGGRTILGQDNNNWNRSKLKPIWFMWVHITKMIKDEVFVQIEDDTIAPPKAVQELLNNLISLKKAAFVTAIETGRNLFITTKVRLGVHYIKREGNKIIERMSLSPDTKGIVEIDSAGVYCFAAFLKDWKKAFIDYQKYVKEVPFFAMDNLLTHNIKLNGGLLYANFGHWCDHMQATGGILYPFNKKNAVQMADLWIPQFNNYAQAIEIKKEKKK